MIILNVGTRYNLFGLNCQKGGKTYLKALLTCLSHTLDPFEFGA